MTRLIDASGLAVRCVPDALAEGLSWTNTTHASISSCSLCPCQAIMFPCAPCVWLPTDAHHQCNQSLSSKTTLPSHCSPPPGPPPAPPPPPPPPRPWATLKHVCMQVAAHRAALDIRHDQKRIHESGLHFSVSCLEQLQPYPSAAYQGQCPARLGTLQAAYSLQAPPSIPCSDSSVHNPMHDLSHPPASKSASTTALLDFQQLHSICQRAV